MDKYVCKKIEFITGDKAEFHHVIINGKNRLEKFFNELEKTNHKDNIRSVYLYMQQISDGYELPYTKFRQVKGKGFSNLYEIKKGTLRVYCIYIRPNYYIPFAGFKDSERTDYETLRRIAKDFMTTYTKLSKQGTN